MVDKIGEAGLRWFGDVKRSTDTPVRRWERLVVVGVRRGRGKPKNYWEEVIRQEMVHFELTEDTTLGRRFGGTFAG